MVKSESHKSSVFFALVFVQILFGINYITSKSIVDVFPPLVWASLRLSVAAGTLFGIAYVTRKKTLPLNKNFLASALGLSLFGVVINQSSFLVGLSHTTATNSSILNTLIPVFTLLLVTLTGKEPSTPKRTLGFFLALTGVLIIRKVENLSLSDKTLIGDLLTILNCVSYSIFLTIGKKFMKENDPLWTTTWLFIFGSMGLTLLSLPDWRTFHPPTLTPSLIGSICYSILGGTLMAYFLNSWALSKTKSSSVALFIYLQPVVASVLAWLYLGEEITLRTLLSSGLIFLGMLLGI